MTALLANSNILAAVTCLAFCPSLSKSEISLLLHVACSQPLKKLKKTVHVWAFCLCLSLKKQNQTISCCSQEKSLSKRECQYQDWTCSASILSQNSSLHLQCSALLFLLLGRRKNISKTTRPCSCHKQIWSGSMSCFPLSSSFQTEDLNTLATCSAYLYYQNNRAESPCSVVFSVSD